MNDIEARWAASRRIFGDMLRNWRAKNAMPMRAARDWAAECPDILPVKILDSVWTGLEAATSPRTTPQTFFALGALNQAMDRQDKGVIRDRRLRDCVDHCEPIRHPDGRAWDAADFFRAFLGELDPPPELMHRKLTAEEAAQQSLACRRVFREEVAQRGGGVMAAFEALLRASGSYLTGRQKQRLEEVLLLGGAFTPEELEALDLQRLLADWLASG